MSSGGNYKQRGVRVKPTSRASIRKLAGQFRQLMELDTPRLDTSSLIEHKLLELVTFHVDDPTCPVLANDEHACAYPDEGIIVLSLQTYDEMCEDVPRARFTLAHELGHVLMHGSNVQGFNRAHTLSSKPHKAYCDSEWQADAFAAELLMPASLAKHMSEAEIADAFGVSATAAAIRCRTLKNE